MFDFLKSQPSINSDVTYELLNDEDPSTDTNPNNKLITTVGLSADKKMDIYKELSEKLKNAENTTSKTYDIRYNITSLKIQEIVTKYSDDVLFETIRIHINSNRIITEYLHEIVPKTIKNAKYMIFICVKNHVPVRMIEKLIDKIDIHYIVDHGDTCLYRVTEINYLIELLSSKVLNFDVNHINNRKKTFLIDWTNKNISDDKIVKLIRILIDKKYNFNTLVSGLSLLDFACLLSDNMIYIIYRLIENSFYDITITTMWLHILIHKFDIKYLQYIVDSLIAERPDYKSLMNKIMNNYPSDDDMLLVMTLLKTDKKNKLLDMITYTNDTGNNLLHIASFNHLDKCIRFIMTMKSEICDAIEKKNNDGDTPYDLYKKGSIEMLLYQSVKLF